MKNNLSIPIAILFAGVIIAGALFYGKKNDSQSPKLDSQDGKTDQVQAGPSPVTKDDHILGNPDASLTMIEFSDTECPYCKRFHGTMKKVMEEYGKDGRVNWVYRHFPLDSLHPKSRKEAEATECAAELGGNDKFWEYINRIYEITPSNNGLNPEELPAIAEYVGLDKTAFEECLASGKYAEVVKKDYQDGIKSGVRGTPNTVIIAKDGRRVVIGGAFPYVESTPGIFYSPNFKQQKELCSEETKLCGVKIAIEKLLKL